MKAIINPQSFLLILVSILTATLLSACGGGGDSSAGTGSFSAGSASIAGNVSDGVAYEQPSVGDSTFFAAVSDVLISQANASGVPGATVELYLNGSLVSTQTTDSNGNFTFSNLSPGNYTIQIVQGSRVLGKSPVIQLDANTHTNLDLSMDGNLLDVEVEARNGTISGEVEDNTSSDDQNSNDDQNSSDDESDDDASKDQVSSDDDDDDCKDPSCDDGKSSD